jgi:hypothetical protein
MTLASSIVFFSFPDYTLKKKTPVHFLTGMDGDLRALLWSLNFYRASCSATKQKNKEREKRTPSFQPVSSV